MQGDALVDGYATNPAWLNERSCQFGDGLFETIAIVDGEPCLWDAHMARLSEGCRRLRLPLPDFVRLREECRKLCAGRSRGVLKLVWSAGSSERGYRRPAELVPRRILQISAWPEGHQRRPWVLRVCAHRLSENPVLAQIKHLNRLDQVIAGNEWQASEVDEGLMLGQDGRVVCGTKSNLFIQKASRLRTSDVDTAGIAGVVRAIVLDAAAHGDRPVEVGRISLDEVHAADAVFLTNSLIGVVRVGRLEQTAYDMQVEEHPAMVGARRLCHLAEPASPSR
jgi:4-amino-4-deoxychorismate lyase